MKGEGDIICLGRYHNWDIKLDILLKCDMSTLRNVAIEVWHRYPYEH